MIDYSNIYRSFYSGDMDPFYQRLYPRLLSYVSRILGPQCYYLAEDCVQDAVMSVYMHKDQIENAEQWRAWIQTAVRNNALMRLRKEDLNQKYIENELITADEAEDVYLSAIEAEVYATIFSAVKELPEKYRTIFEMSFEQGLKNIEIAKILDVAEVTVRKRKTRLIEILRNRFGKSSDEKIMLALLIIDSVLSR